MRNNIWPGEVAALEKRQEIVVKVVDAEQYSDGFPPSNLTDFMAWLDKAITAIPEEYREAARFEIDTSSSYGDYCASVEVSYCRPETDAEWDARKAHVMQRVQQAESEQRAEFERLKAKFGD